MKHAKKLRSPLKWHGGKSYLARRIIELMPAHKTYVEPFAGGLNVLLNKPRVGPEFVGDINPGLSLFWRVFTDEYSFENMREHLQFMTWARRGRLNKEGLEHAFEVAKKFVEFPPVPLNQVDRAGFAASFLMCNRLSRGGLGKDFAWSDRLRGGQPGDLNSWVTMMASLGDVHRRMYHASVHQMDAVELVGTQNSADTLVYCDPPYLHSTRTAKSVYDHEMTDEQHAYLLFYLCGVKSRVMISGYPSALYDASLSKWTRHDFEMPNHSGQGKTKQRRVECVWCNF
jgi:DNA adenine methylase